MANISNLSINVSMINVYQNQSWSSNSYTVIALSQSARFWSMLITTIPCIASSLFYLYKLITDKNLRKLLYNHVIIALVVICLVYQMLDIPEHLIYYTLGYVWPRVPFSCLLWWFVGIGVLNMLNIVMAWASIERYILIFYEKLMDTTRKRLFFHYIPLIMLIIYGLIFYIYVIGFPPCHNQYLYDADWCATPCYSTVKYLKMFDGMINGILPTLIIVFFNGALLIRYVLQKHRLRQRVRWRQCRKMIIQLVSISVLFLIFNLPVTGFAVAYFFGATYGSGGQYELFTYFLCHLVPLLTPFVCFCSSTDILIKVKKIALWRHFQNRVRPQVIAVGRIRVTTNGT